MIPENLSRTGFDSIAREQLSELLFKNLREQEQCLSSIEIIEKLNPGLLLATDQAILYFCFHSTGELQRIPYSDLISVNTYEGPGNKTALLLKTLSGTINLNSKDQSGTLKFARIVKKLSRKNRITISKDLQH